MKTKWLFPHSYRLVGWLTFIPSVILGLASMYSGSFLVDASDWWSELIYSNHNLLHIFKSGLTDEIAAIGLIIGLLLIAFSREKVEDEMIGQLRLEALQWSVYANYLILAIATLTVYDTAFLSVMIYNMFTVLLVFIIRFRWLIYRNNQMAAL